MAFLSYLCPLEANHTRQRDNQINTRKNSMYRIQEALLASGIVALAGTISFAAPPNIVFILADDLGYGDVAMLKSGTRQDCDARDGQAGRARHDLYGCTFHFLRLYADSL